METIYYLEEIRSHGDPPYERLGKTNDPKVLEQLYGESSMGYTYGTHILDSGTYEQMKKKYPKFFKEDALKNLNEI